MRGRAAPPTQEYIEYPPGVTFVGLVQSSFLVSCFQVSGYCCNLCIGHYICSEFYCAQCLGHLDQFLECFSVLSHPPLPFIIITILLLLSLLLLLLLVITVIIISTELLALCDGCSGWGWVWRAGLMTGLRQGRLVGCSCCLGLGPAAPAPRFLGTQPLYAMQALRRIKPLWGCSKDKLNIKGRKLNIYA